MIELGRDWIELLNQRFRVRLSTAARTERLVESFEIASASDGRFDRPIRLSPWTGFAGITSHTREFFITTEAPQSPRAEVLDDTDDIIRVRYGPLLAASWEVFWTLTLRGDHLGWDVFVRVGRQTLPDDEVNLLAFDVPLGSRITQAWFDTGYILPPREWFTVEPPEVTYRGNDEYRGILDRRVRLKFAGDGHETLYVDLADGCGLSFTCKETNTFRIVPEAIARPKAPRDPARLATATFQWKSPERIAIGPAHWNEARIYHPGEQLHAAITIRAHHPAPIETMLLDTPDPTVADRTMRFHRSHAHGSIAHRAGFAGGWHNTGRPDGLSVSFEYFMHGKAHLYGLHPAIDRVMANALDSVYQRETHPDGLVWQHGFGGRGAFYENNASMLIFLADYVRKTGELSRIRYGETWAEYILANCSDDLCLYKAPNSTGKPGFGNGAYVCNWWDVVACGGYDAFINALTYPGLRDLALMEEAAGNAITAKRYAQAAERHRQAFNDLFWDEAEGRYISWVDTDGGRHDYFFTATNLIAAYEQIADADRRKRIIGSIDARLAEIGYTGFSLPCNLIPIPPEHYNAGDFWHRHYGYPHFYDSFGTYENGGIFPWYSAYYIAAKAEFDPDGAYDHFLAILDQYDRDQLQGAGNGYFWNPETGEVTEGSLQEPYLANVAMNVWGLFSLFGVKLGFDGSITVEPRLPQRLIGSRFDIRHRGRRVRFDFNASGSTSIDIIDRSPDT